MPCFRLITQSPGETEQLGSELGSLLPAGMFLALQGTLGCGKTCFTRGVVAAVAAQSAHLVASPTYAIMSCYAGTPPVYHFDFYRLNGDDDVAELGFEELFSGDGICIAEWSERLTELLPPDHLQVTFEYLGEDRRSISISSRGEKFAPIVTCLQERYCRRKNL